MTDKERDQIISALEDYCGSLDGCSHCPVNNKIGHCQSILWGGMTDEQLAIAARAAGVDKTPQPDMVNKPNHYQLPGGMECWDVMVACFGADEVKIWAKINAFTYLFRHKRKNGEEDIRKALVNLEKYFELGADK